MTTLAYEVWQQKRQEKNKIGEKEEMNEEKKNQVNILN
jgi:hypothetical protein